MRRRSLSLRTPLEFLPETEGDPVDLLISEIDSSKEARPILSKIQELHVDLEAIHSRLAVLNTASTISNEPVRRLVIVNHILPAEIYQDKNDRWQVSEAFHKLPIQLQGMKGQPGRFGCNISSIVWVGAYPGEPGARLTRKLWNQHQMIAVPLPQETYDLFLHDFCKVLWCVLHYLPTQVLGDTRFRDDAWAAYQEANDRFAAVIHDNITPDDIIWVNDYHLMLLPELLRHRLGPETPIGFFLHTPFPSSEKFKLLPNRETLIEGLLGSDLIGFLAPDYSRHFRTVCMRLLGTNTNLAGIETSEGFTVRTGIYLTGVDIQRYRNIIDSEKGRASIRALRQLYGAVKVILGVDTMDFVHGIPHKLLAFEAMLEKYPSLQGQVIIVQLAYPDSNQTDSSRPDITGLVGRINGRFSTLDWIPIHYFNRHLDDYTLYALYSQADVMAFTPLRDGMSLVPYEYIACQDPESCGSILLSEFTGSVNTLPNVFRCNPWDTDDLADKMYTALTLSQAEREMKFSLLHHYIQHHNLAQWRQSFAIDILRAYSQIQQEQSAQVRLSANFLKAPFLAAKNRLFILSYDGTLVPHTWESQPTRPSQLVLNALDMLAKDPKNTVIVVTWRSKEIMETLIQSTDVYLACEFGHWYRFGDRTTPWKKLEESQDSNFEKDIERIVEYYQSRLAGSYVDRKEVVISWHFRDADQDFALYLVSEAREHLHETLVGTGYEVIADLQDKVLHVLPQSLARGAIIRHLFETATEKVASSSGGTGANSGLGVGVDEYPSTSAPTLQSPRYMSGRRMSLGTMSLRSTWSVSSMEGGLHCPYDMVLCIGSGRSDEELFHLSQCV